MASSGKMLVSWKRGTFQLFQSGPKEERRPFINRPRQEKPSAFAISRYPTSQWVQEAGRPKENAMKMVNKSALVFALAAVMAMGFALPASAVLDAVGPINPNNGFPIWYRDTTPLSLELCLDNSGFCVLPLGQTFPITFPGNFPDESFYWNATADTNMATGGRATLVLGLEATFNGGIPLAGDQIVFSRVRIRIDTPIAGTYTVVYPFGTEVFPNTPAGTRGINFTRDIGIGAPGDFTGALKGDIGPFLLWDPAVPPAAPTGYIGDGVTLHTVVGSPTGNNVFRVFGPPGSNLGGQGNDTFETNLFTASGKISTFFGVAADRMTYSLNATDRGRLDAFATSVPGQLIQVSGIGRRVINMIEDPAGSGEYFARIPVGVTVPFNPVTISNQTDNPPTVVTGVPVVDKINILIGRYLITDAATGAGTLTVRASSSDQGTAPPTLSVLAGGNVVGILAPVAGQSYSEVSVPMIFPPARITVSSTAGGSITEMLDILGPGTP